MDIVSDAQFVQEMGSGDPARQVSVLSPLLMATSRGYTVSQTVIDAIANVRMINLYIIYQ